MTVHTEHALGEAHHVDRAEIFGALDEAIKPYGMRRAVPDDVPALTELAHRLMKAETLTGDAATLEDILRVESWSERTLYVRERNGECVGFIALVFLTTEGHAALRSGELDAHIAERTWVADLTEQSAGVLLWSMGGVTGGDRAAVVRTLLAIWAKTDPSVPGYSRAATRHGLRLMVRLGFKEVVSVPGRAPVWGRNGSPTQVMDQRAYRRTGQGEVDQPKPIPSPTEHAEAT